MKKLTENLIYIISINSSDEDRKKFEENLKKYSDRFVFLSMTSYDQGYKKGDFTYEVELKNKKSLNEIKESTIKLGITSVRIIFGESEVGS